MNRQALSMAVVIALVVGVFVVALTDRNELSTYVSTMIAILATISGVGLVNDKVNKVSGKVDSMHDGVETVKQQTNGALNAKFADVHAKIDALADAVSKATPKVEPPTKTAQVIAKLAPKPVPVLGCDVSGYQADDFPVEGLSFVFVKVSEGTGYINPRAAAQIAWARKHGLVVGLYHFLHHGNVAAQVAYFLSVCKRLGFRPGDILLVDWEDAQATQADRNAFLAGVMKGTKHNRVGTYCNKDFWFNRDTQNYAGDFLFIAAPSDPMGKPNIKHPWVFHQYSSADGLDHDVANFKDKAALVAWANGGNH